MCNLYFQENKKIDRDVQHFNFAIHTGNVPDASRIIIRNQHLQLDPSLLIAASHGDVEMVTLLLDHGASVNYADRNGLTALHFAASNSAVAVINLLLDRGANIKIRTLHEIPRSALDYAAFKDHGAAAQALLSRGSELYFPYRHKLFSSLYVAARNNSVKCFKILLQYDHPNDIKIDCVVRAMQEDFLGIVKCYLDGRGNPNAKTNLGNSLLHFSVIHHCLGIVKLLLSSGANPNVLNDRGETPIDLARIKRNKPIYDLLKEACALFPHPVPKVIRDKNEKGKTSKLSNRNKHLSHNSGTTSTDRSSTQKEENMASAWYNKQGANISHAIRKNDKSLSVKEGETYTLFAECTNKYLRYSMSTPLPKEKCDSLPIVADQVASKEEREKFAISEERVTCSEGRADASDDLNDNSTSSASYSVWPPCTAQWDYGKKNKKKDKTKVSDRSYRNLHSAVKEGDIKKVMYLLKNGADVNACNSEGKNVFHVCAALGDVKCFHVLVDNNNMGILTPDLQDGNTPLHIAALHGHLSMCLYILGMQVSPNIVNKNNETPLFLAVKNYPIAELLVNYNADVNAKNSLGTTVLHYAVRDGTTEVILMLLRKGANVNKYCGSDGRSPLHWAAIYDRKDVFDTLIMYGGDYKAITRDRYGDYLVHLAAGKGNVDILRIMKENNLIKDVNEKNKTDNSPLHLAAMSGSVKTVQYLLQIGADIGSLSKHLHTPLHAAALEGRTEVTEILINAGADPNLILKSETPLHFAIKKDKVACLKLLLSYVGHLHVEGSDPLLFTAVHWGAKRCIYLLVMKGVDVNMVFNINFTPIHIAVLCDQVDVIPVLIELGANINSQVYNWRTPIHLATDLGNPKMVKLLTRYNPDFGLDSLPPIYLAIRRDRTDLMILLKDYREPLNDANRDSRLHWAARHRSINCAQWLVDREGDDVNMRNANGETPFHLAVMNKHEEMEEFLLRRGADKNARTFEGQVTPLQIAVNRGHVSSVVRLLEYNAHVDEHLLDNKKQSESKNIDIIIAVFEMYGIKMK